VSRLAAFGRFWWDFVVGDDWLVAAGLVLVLALTALVADDGVDAWWILPVGVVGLLVLSLRRATGRRGPR
jgi:hypothetical protein